jgi:hypothetical protein
VVIDPRTRQMFGYSLSKRMSEDLIRQAFLNNWTVRSMPCSIDLLPVIWTIQK